MALEIVKIFPVHIREALANDTWKAGLEEIRVRVGSPLEFILRRGEPLSAGAQRAYVSRLLPADMRAAIG